MNIGFISNFNILVIGDLILDRYYFGNVERISPEAPVPILQIKKQTELLGGAGNVAANLKGLGGNVSVIGVCGEDDENVHLTNLMDSLKINKFIFEIENIPTIVKSRVISNGQQLIRLDKEVISNFDDNIYDEILFLLRDRISEFDAIILSDYGKGILNSVEFTVKIIDISLKNNIPVFVDPKGSDWSKYKRATCITPNISEIELVCGRDIIGEISLIEAMKEVKKEYNLSSLLVTRGKNGMCLLGPSGTTSFIPTVAREVFDVSGAGDTVISTLAAGVSSGLNLDKATKLANYAAGIVVGKVGTQPIDLFELQSIVQLTENSSEVSFSNKVISISSAKLQVQAWQAEGLKVVFTNGCFDLLHPGHIHLLKKAKELGDRLVIGLNSDRSVRRLKGNHRPILSESDRASLLAALDSVDMVVLFGQDTPEKVISLLRPDVLAKGSDYSIDEVVGGDIVNSYGGNIELIQLMDGYSTTIIAQKIKDEG